TAHLLFFAKLQTIAHQLRFTVFAMLPWDEVTLFDGALLTVTALALQKQLHALAPTQPADRASISCQMLPPYLLPSGAVYGPALGPSSCLNTGSCCRARQTSAKPALQPGPSSHTLLFFGGRHPL